MKRKLLNPIIFCTFLFFTAGALLLLPNREYSQREKRYLSSFPTLSWQSIADGTAQEQTEDWIADQFPGRDAHVGIHAYWNLLMGRNNQQDFYHAKDGYLIQAPASQDLTIFQTSLSRFDQFAANCGVPVSMIMIPSNGWLQESRLPLGHLEYPDDQMFQIAQETLQNMTFWDFRSKLKEADLEADVCYRTDHHLTAYGNYTLYQAWRQERGLPCLDQEAYTVETVPDFYGTAWSGSGYWLTAPDQIALWDSGVSATVTITDGGEEPHTSEQMFYRSHLDSLDKYPVYLDGNHCQTEIFNASASEGTILLIKDSYAHCFATFLADHYQHVILLDLRYYRGSISDFIKQNDVDEVLFFYGTSTLLTDTNSAWLF